MANEEGTDEAPFRVCRAVGGASPTGIVFASPHSGRIYPADLMAATHLDAETIRRSEDAHVDELIAGAPSHGIAVLTARMARAWMDVNREPWEMDAGMFEGDVPAYARARTAKVAAGLGVIARVVGEGQEIYRRKLTFAEAMRRVETVHKPYHGALTKLLGAARRVAGAAVLIDWHSMPSATGPDCEMVLGDRYGATCGPTLTRLVEDALTAKGYRVARNAPYAGGYTTQHYGRPQRRIHALQIEINRAIYMDERTLTPTADFASLKSDLDNLFMALASVNPAEL